MIEKLITELVAALNANTEALTNSAPATGAPAAAKKKTTAAKTAKTSEPVKEEAPPAADPAADEPLTADAIKAVAKKKDRAAVLAALQKYSVAKFSELPEESYQAFFKDVQALADA